MAQPTVTTVTETYEGQSITCAKIVATETSTQQFTNVATSNDDQYFQIVIKTTSSDKTISFTLGGVTKTKTITTSFDKYTIGFPDTNVLNSKHLTMSIPAGAQYVYNLQLERGLYPSQWRPAPEDSADYTDASSASTLTSAQTYADGAAASAVSGQTQQDIFNKLTNNGAVQGIVLQNGQLYINGAYIQAGTIVSTGLDSTTQTKIDNGDTANSRAVACRGTCSTAATTAAKVVTSTNFSLVTGSTVTVYFSTANTKADAALTLNVNSTGAKTIYVAGAATSSTNQLLWVAGSSITFTYDGTGWKVENDAGTYYCGTCSTAAATAAKTATCTGAIIFKGVSVHTPMTYENTSTGATLNLASLGAKNIYYGTSTTRPTTSNGRGWLAGRTATFWFDGAYYRLQESSTIIDGGHIITGTIDASKVTVNNLNASNIKSGTIDASSITINNINASKITSGTINASTITITNINANNITAGKISSANGKVYFDLTNNQLACDRIISTESSTDMSKIIAQISSKSYNSVTTRGLSVYSTDNNNEESTFISVGRSPSNYNLPNSLILGGRGIEIGAQISSTGTWASGSGVTKNYASLVFTPTGQIRLATDNPPVSGSSSIEIAPRRYSPDGTDAQMGFITLQSYSGMALNVNKGVRVNGNFSVSGSKNRTVHTDQYEDVLLYSYETTSPMFGDIGDGEISDDGYCYIFIDPVFAETVSTNKYQVFLQKYNDGSDLCVYERHPSYFVVKGTPNTSFGWEIKAKQKDFSQSRLEKDNGINMFSPMPQTYGEDGDTYYEQLQDGRINLT